MQTIRRLFDFYLNASIHVALTVVALVYITLLEFDIARDNTLLLFSFFAAITAYNFVKYFGTARFYYKSLTPSLKAIQIVSFVSFLPLIYYVFQLSSKVLIWLVLLGVLTFFYAIPFKPVSLSAKGDKSLRAISGIKVYIIAIVWSVFTVIIPIVDAQHTINFDVIISTAQRFILVLILMLPFEIRDMQFDSLNLETIPQKIGVKRTKIVGVLLIMGFFFLEFFKDNLEETWVVANLFLMLILVLALLLSNKEQNMYYAAFWVEAIPLFWLGILLMLR